jgi:hypothetical protein
LLYFNIFFVVSCGNKTLRITQIKGVQLPITEKESQVIDIEYFIKPYREHITKDLDSLQPTALKR